MLKLTLKVKLLGVTIGLVVVTTFAMAYFLSWHLGQSLEKREINELAQSSQLLKQLLQKELEHAQGTARFIASSRVIKGLIEADDKGNGSLVDLIEQQEWKENIVALFLQSLSLNNHYFKIRYIKYQNQNGKASAKEEIVIKRVDGGLVQLGDSELQEKIHRHYVQDALALKPNTAKLSQIDLNRERDQISVPITATIRALAPVYLAGELRGIIVISVDFSALLQTMDEIVPDTQRLFILNQNKYFVFHEKKERIFSFEFPAEQQFTLLTEFPNSELVLHSNIPQQQVVKDTSSNPALLAIEPLKLNTVETENYIYLALTRDYSNIDQEIRALNRVLITVGIVIVALGILLSWLMIYTLSKPFADLVQGIKRFGLDQTTSLLPVHRTDEIGNLARSFQQTAHSVNEKSELLKQEITVRKYIEETLKVQSKELKRSNEELEKFAYVASHDLQEPLRKVQAFGDRLKKHSGSSLDQKSQDYLDRMQSAASRMSQLISDLLSFSRIATRKNPRELVALDSILDGVLQDLEIAIEQAKAQIVRKPLCEAKVDKVQFRQLFQNLIGNAIKFRKPDGQHIIEIWATFNSNKSEVEIHIKDNGIGFSQQYADRVFEVFQRLHARTEYQGTGIGLAICRKIVERHQGELDVLAEVGTGAEFIIRLPLNDDDEQSENS